MVVGERGGELGGGVDDVEGEGLVVVGAPGAGPGGVDDCLAGGGVVPSEMVGHAGEGGGDLTLV